MAEDLLTLISAGQLPEGTVLHHRGRDQARNVKATVVSGGIRFEGAVYPTPSGAAKVVTGAPVDGWAFWKLPNGERLDTLRSAQYRLG
jgi:Restriction Enzyme Adenine Methylase Associated